MIKRIIDYSEEIVNTIIEGVRYNKKAVDLSRELGLKLSTVMNICRANHLELSKGGYLFDTHYFQKIDTKDKAYFLGWLYSDGCVHDTGVNLLLKYDEGNIKLLNLFKKYIKSTHRLEETNMPRRDPVTKEIIGYQHAIKIRIGSAKIRKQLIDLGCFQNKTFILKFPTEDQVPFHLIRHFIRGYFDGDGSVWKTMNGKYTMYGASILGTDSIINSLGEFFKKYLPLRWIIYPHATSEGISGIRLSSRENVIKFGDDLYEDCDDLYLERKKEFYESIPEEKVFDSKRDKEKIVMEILTNSKIKLTAQEIFKASNYFYSDIANVCNLLKSMCQSDKIQKVKDGCYKYYI